MRFTAHTLVAILLGAAGAAAYPSQALQDEPAAVEEGPHGFAAQNGGTTGGKGGQRVEVKTFEELLAAVKGDEPKIVVVTGTIQQDGKIPVGSNKSILGKDSSAEVIGGGFMVKRAKNVIFRNLKISKVKADNGDAIGIQFATNVWVDHCDLSSDMEHDKDFYDGLLDVTHGGDFITVSYTHFHDHYKASLVGHSDNNAKEDTGHLRITYHNNWWSNINSRAPSIRFGTGHIYNSLFENVKDGINSRQGAQVLAQNNVFVNSSKPLYSTDRGFAVDQNNQYGNGKAKNTALQGTLTQVPYEFTLDSAEKVNGLNKVAGATLTL